MAIQETDGPGVARHPRSHSPKANSRSCWPFQYAHTQSAAADAAGTAPPLRVETEEQQCNKTSSGAKSNTHRDNAAPLQLNAKYIDDPRCVTACRVMCMMAFCVLPLYGPEVRIGSACTPGKLPSRAHAHSPLTSVAPVVTSHTVHSAPWQNHSCTRHEIASAGYAYRSCTTSPRTTQVRFACDCPASRASESAYLAVTLHKGEKLLARVSSSPVHLCHLDVRVLS